MTLLQHRNFSARLRSGSFAFVFAPIALLFLGSSMVDVQALAAVGQPLASVEGLIGMALASLLLALIALNCEESSAGMVVTFLWSLAVGAAQFMGVARIPFFMKASVQSDDMAAGVLWSLYPVCISLMLGACALTIKSVRARAGRETRMPLARVHRHAFGTTVALPAALAVSVLMVSASPSDTTNVAALGLEGVLAGHSMGHGLALGAGLALALLVVSARWSITGAQLATWLILVLPTYVVVPVWASLTGNVIVPGPSILTKLALASPTLAALGMATGCASMGVLWARVRALRSLDSSEDTTHKEGPAED